MEWDDLRHFLAVARAGSLADAARQLKNSPATVGRRVAALEAQLGARLFDRKQTGYTLTESGLAIHKKAEEVEEAVLSVEREALGRDLHVSGRVRLATSDEIAANVIVPHFSEFRRCYPRILLEVVARVDLANLSRREADVALRTARPEQHNLFIRRAGWWKCGLYAAKSYAAAHDLEPGVIRDFSNLDIITWTEEFAHYRGGPWFAEHARDASVALQANSRRIHYGACKAGLGLAILPCLTADRDPDLTRLLPPEQVFVAELYLVTHRDLTRTARVRAVIDFFHQSILDYTR
jgi:DNA-binding transcriptional LysR family regulator